jgi:hypothetical protein
MSEHSTATCRICKERKPQIEFPVTTNTRLMPDGSRMKYNVKRRSCFTCVTKRQRDSELLRLGSEEQRLDYCRKKSQKCMFKKFGLSLEEGYSILESQNYQCAICQKNITLERTELRNDRAILDHCHKSGKFRGFLCHRCNAALGLFDDNASVLQKAADYLLGD